MVAVAATEEEDTPPPSLPPHSSSLPPPATCIHTQSRKRCDIPPVWWSLSTVNSSRVTTL